MDISPSYIATSHNTFAEMHPTQNSSDQLISHSKSKTCQTQAICKIVITIICIQSLVIPKNVWQCFKCSVSSSTNPAKSMDNFTFNCFWKQKQANIHLIDTEELSQIEDFGCSHEYFQKEQDHMSDETLHYICNVN